MTNSSERKRNEQQSPSKATRWIIATTSLLIGLLGLWQLPPGACFGDAGDLQTASATLGIAHPPGYVGFAAIGWLLTKALPFIEPAYVVSLACLACMAVSAALLMGLIVRAGASALLAGALALALLASASVWESLSLPEVYAPSLVLVLAAAWLLLAYGRTHRLRWLLAASACLGLAVANRPPVVLMLPGFVIAACLLERQAGWRTRRVLRRALAATAAFAIPALGTAALTAALDQATHPYNYLEQYNELHGELPASSEGLTARCHRLHWLLTSRQFRAGMGADAAQMRAQLRYLRRQLGLYDALPAGCGLAVLLLGAIRLARRQPAAVCLAIGIIAGQFAFLLQYRVRGQAADLLPVLFAAAWLAGSAGSLLMPRAPARTAPLRGARQWAAGLVWLATAVWTVHHAELMPDCAGRDDAQAWLAAQDWSNVPASAVVWADWNRSRPLLYRQQVHRYRPDVHIVSGHGDRDLALLQAWVAAGRAVFTVQPDWVPPGWHREGSDALAQLLPAATTNERTTPAHSGRGRG